MGQAYTRHLRDNIPLYSIVLFTLRGLPVSQGPVQSVAITASIRLSSPRTASSIGLRAMLSAFPLSSLSSPPVVWGSGRLLI